MKSWTLTFVSLFALCLGASAGAQEPQAPPTQPQQAYVIGLDDQVVVHVSDTTDISDKPQRVDPNGDIKLPTVGRVHAAGLTPAELEAALTERFKHFLNEPDVSVSVLESRSQPVSVIGAVAAPGVRQLEGRKTLVEMLSTAGGVTADAGPTVRVTRRIDRGRLTIPGAADDVSGQYSIAEIDLRTLLDGRSPASDIVLQPNDVISISRADMVYVIGEVSHAGPLPLARGNSMSILEAVSSSGGVLRTAASSQARILRLGAVDQKRTEIPVDIKKIMNGKANDMTLMAGDILVVPDSTGKRATARAIEAAVQMGLMIGTYGIIR